jgi:hypothetical protein
MSAQPLPATQAPRKTSGRAPARPAGVPARHFGRGLLALVPPPARARRAPFVVLLLVLLASGLIGLLLLNTASAQDSFRLHALQDEDATLQQEQQALTGLADGLDDPAVLAKRAAALGLVPGGPPLFLPRGVPIPKGAIRVGNLIYAPGAVAVTPPPQVVTPPAAKPSVKAAATKPAVKKPVTTRRVPAVRPTVTPVKPATKVPVATVTKAPANTTPTRVTPTTAPAAGVH